jgi:hypothetical protein
MRYELTEGLLSEQVSPSCPMLSTGRIGRKKKVLELNPFKISAGCQPRRGNL